VDAAKIKSSQLAPANCRRRAAAMNSPNDC
jgi:hypothetical protein